MKIIGIICEYNPFHLGHLKQFDMIRRNFGEDCAIVCLMSGNFVQRGHPAVFDKSLRAQAALSCGADLVLELPITCALSSAEGFAAGGVEILSGFCDYLCFGTETGNEESLMATAKLLLSPDFPPLLRGNLETGISFPAAREKAISQLGGNSDLLRNPNDILGVEYCKAMISQGSAMRPFPIHRDGNYHATEAEALNPSATSIRKMLTSMENWTTYVPADVHDLYWSSPVHTLENGEQAILYRLRTMTDAEFEALPYGSEGLWRRFMHACRKYATLEEILTNVKTKRYTRARLDRMVMCAFLGISDLSKPCYTRVLGFNKTGAGILKVARKHGTFLHISDKSEDPYALIEKRADDVYGLFAAAYQEAPNPKRNVIVTER